MTEKQCTSRLEESGKEGTEKPQLHYHLSQRRKLPSKNSQWVIKGDGFTATRNA